MGFPFFRPAYVPGNHVTHLRLPRRARAGVPPPAGGAVASRWTSRSSARRSSSCSSSPAATTRSPGLRVRAKLQRHGGDSYGYRFEQRRQGGRLLHRLRAQARGPRRRPQAFVDFFRDADLVIFDAMYSLADAISVKEDWGHSSNVVGVELCQMARAKHLCLFHHEPVFDDEQIAACCRRRAASRRSRAASTPSEVSAAYDGLEIDVCVRRERADGPPARGADGLAAACARPRPARRLVAARAPRRLRSSRPSLAAQAAAPGELRHLPAPARRAARVRRRSSSSTSTRRASRATASGRGRARCSRGSSSDRPGRPAAIGLRHRDAGARPPLPGPAGASSSPASTRSLAGGSPRLPSNDSVLAAVIAGGPSCSASPASRSPRRSRLAGRAARPCARVGGDPAPVRRFGTTLQERGRDRRAAAGHGLLNVDLEGGVVRRVPARRRGRRACSCPPSRLEMLRVAAGEPGVSVSRRRARRRGGGRRRRRVPTQPDGTVWVHYTRHDPERFVSAADVLAGAADARLFEGKLVLIGVTALGRRRLPGHAGGRSHAGRRDPRPAHREHLRRRPALAPVVDRLARGGGARRGGRAPDPRAARAARGRRRPRSPRPSPRRRWRSRSASTSAGGSCSTRRCRSSASACCSRRCSARPWRRPRASAARSAARWRGSARPRRGWPASSRRRAASRWAACRPRPPPSPARRASTSTRFSSRRARSAATSTTSSSSTPTGSSSWSATCRARGCRAASSWR